jgi:hypothetical protein
MRGTINNEVKVSKSKGDDASRACLGDVDERNQEQRSRKVERT